jgi:hypothetical protein
VAELQQTAVRTPDKFKGAGSDFFGRAFGEHPGQYLMPEIKDRHQVLAAAYTTFIDLFVRSHGQFLQSLKTYFIIWILKAVPS